MRHCISIDWCRFLGTRFCIDCPCPHTGCAGSSHAQYEPSECRECGEWEQCDGRLVDLRTGPTLDHYPGCDNVLGYEGFIPFTKHLLIAIVMTFMMWNWWSVYIAGELKSAGKLRRQLSVMLGALAWDTLFLIIGVLLLYRSAGEQFIASINFLSTSTTGYALPVQPYYNLMASIVANNPVFAILIAVSFLFWNLPAMFPNTFMPVRTIFAWSFDFITKEKNT